MSQLLYTIAGLIVYVFQFVYNHVYDFITLPDSIVPFCVTLIVIALFLAFYWLFRITVSFIQFVFNL